MATLYISEYQGIAATSQVPQEPSLATQTVAIGVSSVQSQPFSGQTRLVRIATDSICSIAIGANPTATTANPRMAANQTEYRGVMPGQVLAVISNV